MKPISVLLSQNAEHNFHMEMAKIPEGLFVNREPLPEVLFITSFPPRECGIATYTQDLVKALSKQFNNSFITTICALESKNEIHAYPEVPKFILNTSNENSFAKTLFRINNDNRTKLVVLQHEFGFYNEKEADFEQFYQNLTKPLVFVFHTVLPAPAPNLARKVQKMVEKASSVVVMTHGAAQILREDYNVSTSKIVVIPHGTHLVAPLNRKKVKAELQLSNRKILSTFGLLGWSKNIETTLNALPTVVAKHPEVIFLILGKTHPSLLKKEGETYREMLQQKVIDLHLENHVLFVNEYLQLPKLLDYLQISDIYLFTSNDPNQAVSGTFSYALSSGCPIISTPIPHAKEILNSDNGLFFNFEDDAMLGKAIINLLDNAKFRKELSSKSFHKMASTAWENSAMAHTLLFKRMFDFELDFVFPTIRMKHIKRLTTSFGMIQFSQIAEPDLRTGFTLDDNARALIAACQHFELTKDADDLNLIQTYLDFLKFCFRPNGLFLNYVNAEKKFTSANFYENLEDSNGRAIWALGYVCSLRDFLPKSITNEADYLLERSLHSVQNTYSTRAMAFIIKGLYYQGKEANLVLMDVFANRLVRMFHHENKENWHWFESYLTYGNSLLPEALLCASLALENEEYKTIAKESFDFLLSKTFQGNKIKVISNKGWLFRGNETEKQIGGEQPIDVAYTIMALEKFYSIFKTTNYKNKMTYAFNWFLVDNHLNQIVYNPCTGGCYDGVEEHNVNLNQGAESTVSYLLARLAIERLSVLSKTKFPNLRRHTPYLLENREGQFADV